MPSMEIKEKFSQDEKKVGENIVNPGLTDRTNQPMKKPVVIMSDKYQPNFTCKHIEDNAVQFIFQVDEETLSFGTLKKKDTIVQQNAKATKDLIDCDEKFLEDLTKDESIAGILKTEKLNAIDRLRERKNLP